MKRVLITGANGFVGRHLCQHLLNHTDWYLILLDQILDDELCSKGRVTRLEGGLENAAIIERALSFPLDIVFHLAALPGGAAEQNPGLSREINLNATLDLLDGLGRQGNCPRVVYSSTIAVLGSPLPEVVDDQSPVRPRMIYGTHKAMIELALADYTRRNKLNSVAVRLPGIIARPFMPNGLKSAFLSNAFHHIAAGHRFTSPVSCEATMWLMSVQQCVKNLVHAARVSDNAIPTSRVVTLPAVRTTMQALLETLLYQTGSSESLLEWQPDEDLEQDFGQQPPLLTPVAEAAGFRSDQDLASLVAAGLSLI